MGYMGFGMQKNLQKQKEVFSKKKAEGKSGGSLHRYRKGEVPRALKIFRIIVYFLLPAIIVIGLIICSSYASALR
jgi:hypothetical protein